MQQLLKYIDTMPFVGSQEHSHLVNIIQQELLAKEKEDHRNTFKAGKSFQWYELYQFPSSYAPDFETHYTQTYNTKNKS